MEVDGRKPRNKLSAIVEIPKAEDRIEQDDIHTSGLWEESESDIDGQPAAGLTVVQVSKTSLLPPDGGWGWCVVLGCFMMNLIVNGISYSFGVIFMELLEKYDRTSSDIAWVYSLNCVTCSWLGPLATALSNAFSFRSVVVVGGLIYSAGIVASSFMYKLEQLYITYGLISGFGSALVYGPSIIMVGRYFDKRRSLANGLSVAGSGVGSFLIPPLLQLLIEKYTINGCILILGAFSLHLCLAGLLYRPLPTGRRVVEPEVYGELTPSAKLCPGLHCTKRVRALPSTGSIKEELYETALYPTRGASSFAMASSLLSIPEQIVIVEKQPTLRLRNFSGASARKNFRNAWRSLYAWPTRMRSGKESESLFDFSLLKDSLFLSFSFAVMLASFGYLSIYLILPAHAQDLHLSKTEAVSLISVMGICDLVGRVGSGIASDFQIIPRKWIFSLMILCATTCVGLIVFAGTSYITLSCFAGLFAFFGGCFMVLNPVITADLFGIERLPSAIGLLITIQGCAYLVGPPSIGAIRDRTKSFYIAFLVIGLVMSAGALLLPLHALIESCLTKRRRPSGDSAKSITTSAFSN
ncbi:hypothetical protein RvY_09998-2 [Ramazzottius varieornatus]|uniref:Major facilitator superfamily (MFS) profile domain-containing protein n=1 Tax=Ramazzottius varieornatus TaxID=947166 RepID=A0A1D1VJ32_RAMVA|nr:hypothetical protein RvY_09998-2 [Ramazzottius varieornatus]